MTDASEWTGRVGTSWAGEWRRTDRSFGALTTHLLDDGAIGAFDAALDIGCGAGELSLHLARTRPDAHVLGVDISGELLNVARARAKGLTNLSFAEVDAAFWQGNKSPAPDLLVSRHGVMFFADPVAAFANLRAQAAPGARLRFSCFRTVAENAWARELGSIAGPPSVPADVTAPGPFAFGDAARVTRILSDAGWIDVALEPLDYAMIASDETPDRDTAVEDALGYFLRIGPAARAISELAPGPRTEAIQWLREILARHFDGARIAMPAAAWIGTARAP